MADIHAAFKKIVNPQQLITVSVGSSQHTVTADVIRLTEAEMMPVSW